MDVHGILILTGRVNRGGGGGAGVKLGGFSGSALGEFGVEAVGVERREEAAFDERRIGAVVRDVLVLERLQLAAERVDDGVAGAHVPFLDVGRVHVRGHLFAGHA